jgi:hypothetical protein
MKYNFLFFAALVSIALFSCKDDEDSKSIYEYHAHIHQPNTDAKTLGDTLHIEVDFESHTGQTVHHINVRINRKSDNSEVYNQPVDAHVHATSGTYTYEDTFVLSATNGLSEGDWVLTATVWGEADGEEEISASVEFQVRP